MVLGRLSESGSSFRNPGMQRVMTCGPGHHLCTVWSTSSQGWEARDTHLGAMQCYGYRL